MKELDQDGGGALRTARLLLRPPRECDAPHLAVLADNWAVASMLARMPHPYDEADAASWIRHALSDGAERVFVIALAQTGTPIGACGISPAEWTDGSQLGYWLGEPYWSRGYATEAAQALVSLAFADPALTHLWCSCRVTNERSRGVLRKCGFQFHGAGMMFTRAASSSVPVEYYCLDREVWLALSAWQAA
jgi:RimJ/RimL family protein N-acetyltransferase